MPWCNFFQTDSWTQNMHKHKRRDLSYQPITADHMQSYYDGGIAFSHMTFPHSFSITPHQWTQGRRESLLFEWNELISFSKYDCSVLQCKSVFSPPHKSQQNHRRSVSFCPRQRCVPSETLHRHGSSEDSCAQSGFSCCIVWCWCETKAESFR